MKFALPLVLLLIFAVSAVYSAPCDLFFASLFYRDGFYLKGNGFVKLVDAGTGYFISVVFLSVFIVRVRNKFNLFTLPAFDFINAKSFRFLTVSFFGWCLAFPYSLKMFFHRARPFQTVLFGGECAFGKAFEKSSCHAGDSFISGHTSFAMWLTALALIAPEKIRKPLILCSLFIVFAVGAGRVMGGYHFFTDVYFAVLSVGSGIFITRKKMAVNETDG